jgi:pSer/pThr/pTyr-binding forkhead associated (FHA) protein
MIMTILNDSFLEDLGSTNGTLVNGQPVKKHFLQNNDVVELGKYKLKYVTEATTAQASPADFEKTMVLRAPAGIARHEPVRDDFGAHVAKNFSDTVVNPDLLQTQGQGLREAARQVAADSLSPASAAAAPMPTAAPPPAPPAQPPFAAVSSATTTTTTASGTPRLEPKSRHDPDPSGPAGKELPLTKALTR